MTRIPPHADDRSGATGTGVQGVGLRGIGLDLLTLLWPTECVGCRAPDRDLCDACADELDRCADAGTLLRGCVPTASSRPDESGAARSSPGDTRQSSAVPLYAAAPYSGVQREVLIALKHGGRLGFARRLGPLLARPLAEAMAAVLHCPIRDAAGVWPVSAGVSTEVPLIACVPSRSARVRQRGYRHVELILSHAVRELREVSRSPGSHASGGALLSRRPPRTLRPLPGRTGQVGLTSADRVRNARRIAVSPGARVRVRGRRVIVVDDVVTTGATVAAACDTLRAAGADVVAVVALCRVERRDTRGDDADGGSGSA